MQRVLLAPRAVLLDLHAIGHVGLVLGGSVITTLALSASQGNHSAHVSKPPFTAPTGTVANITIDHHVMSMPTVLPCLFCKRDSQLKRKCAINQCDLSATQARKCRLPNLNWEVRPAEKGPGTDCGAGSYKYA